LGMDFHGITLESSLSKHEYGVLKEEAKALESKIHTLGTDIGALHNSVTLLRAATGYLLGKNQVV